MAQLLDAAAEVFAEQGYAATTTNAIAAHAGVSPGTLYQFFGNKDEVADALATRYLDELRGVLDATLDAAVSERPLDEIVDAVVTPLVDFNLANPAFAALFRGREAPERLSDAKQPLHGTLIAGLTTMLEKVAPQIPADRRPLVAEVSVQFVAGMLPLLATAPPGRRSDLLEEVRLALTTYLGAHTGPRERPSA